MLADHISFHAGELEINTPKREIYKNGGISSGILLIASIIFILETHHRFSMYQNQSTGMNIDAARLNHHYEEALVQSIIWISISGLLISIIISLYVAKRITSPLLEMRKTAERMAKGELTTRTIVKGEDELTAIAKQNVDAAAASFNQKGVNLELSTDTYVIARVDRQRVSQIIGNLLSNALKFTPKGGTVTVQIIDGISSAAIIVEDTGIGIKESELGFIFERFYRVGKSRNRNTGGSGIGLAIVKKLVESHHGQIIIESIEKQGTLIKIIFPK